MSVTSRIQVLVNGEPQAVEPGALANVLAQLGYGEAKVATALNGDFIPERQRGAVDVKPGDRIEIVSARQGG